MAYIIYNNDGSVLLTMAEGKVDSETTSLDLIGKNVDNYGEILNNNLIRLMTNFAGPTSISPRSPQVGQLWYNTTDKRLTVYNGIEFKPTDQTLVSGTEPLTTSTGDLWYDSVNSQLKIWNGTTYKIVGPAVSGVLGKFGVEPPSVSIKEFGTNIPKNVGVMFSYGASLALATTASFTMSTSSSLIYFGASTSTEIVSGITVIDDLDVKGDVYIRGDIMTPKTWLTAYADITNFGNPADGAASSATIQTRIGNANVSIIADILNYTFNTTTSLTGVSYPIDSEAKVICYFNTASSVRHFILTSAGWDTYDEYFNSYAQTVTNIVVI
jgi:hypothetical protein